jgi:hypothetical protein
LRKYASQLTSDWYKQFLGFQAISIPTPVNGEEFLAFENAFSAPFTSFLKDLSQAPNWKEEYVQSACLQLWDAIHNIFFNEEHCKVDAKQRKVETLFEGILDNEGFKLCRVSGEPDGSIMWHSLGIHIWELKNQKFRLDSQCADLMDACAQIAVYMKADIESMWTGHGVLPNCSIGVLTNGHYWILVKANISMEDSGKLSIRWSHTEPLVNNQRGIFYLIFLACRQSRINLDLVQAQSVVVSFESLNLVDDGSSKGGRADKKDENNDKGNDGSTKGAQPEGQRKPTDADGSNKQSGNNFKTTENSLSKRRRPLATLSLNQLHGVNKLFSRQDLDDVKPLPLFEKLCAIENVFSVTVSELFQEGSDAHN